MKVRVVKCPECGWTKAVDCPHWSMDCPRAKKKKKAHHKLTRGENGYLVALTGINEDNNEWPYSYPIPPEVLELELKRVIGSWQYMDGDDYMNPSRWVPYQPGLLVGCTTNCGFMGAL